MCESVVESISTRDLDMHDRVLLSGPETSNSIDAFTVHLLDPEVTVIGEVLGFFDGSEEGKIQIKARTPKVTYRIEVDQDQHFLRLTPKVSRMSEVRVGDKIILRGDSDPRALGGRLSHMSLAASLGAVSEVYRVKTLKSRVMKITVTIASRKKFTFTTSADSLVEVFRESAKHAC